MTFGQLTGNMAEPLPVTTRKAGFWHADTAIHLFFVATLILCLIDAQFLFGREFTPEMDNGGVLERAIRLLASFLMVGYILKYRSIKQKISALEIFLLLYAVLICFQVFRSPYSISEKIIEIYRWLYWCLILIFMTTAGMRMARNWRAFQVYIILLFCLIMLQLISQAILRTSSGELLAINLAYNVLDLWPLLLILFCSERKSEWPTHRLNLIVGFAIFASLKRGAMLAFAMAWLTMTIYTSIIERRKFSRVVAQWLGLFIGVATLTVLVLSHMDTFSERFADLTSDNAGSGRSIFYELVWNRWYDNMHDPVVKWFGYGHDTVKLYLEDAIRAKIFAHSDYLESIHDYGILGIGIFSMFPLILFCYLWQDMLRKRTTLVKPSLILVVSLFLRGIYSGLLAIPFLMQMPAIFLGLWIATRSIAAGPAECSGFPQRQSKSRPLYCRG